MIVQQLTDLLDHLLRHADEARTRGARHRRRERPEAGVYRAEYPELNPAREQREARGLRAPPHEGPYADVRECFPISRLSECAEGVDGVEKGLGEGAAEPPCEDRGRPAGKACGDRPAAAGGQRSRRRCRADATDVGDTPQ